MSEPSPPSVNQRLPRVRAYLAALPQGLASHPECRQKGSVLRVFTEGLPLERHVEALPEAIRSYVLAPPPVSAWLPEVHVHALYLATADLLFADDEAFAQQAYDRNLKLLSSPLYRVLFRLVGAQRLLGSVSGRWSHMHEGSSLEWKADGARTGLCTLRYPQAHVSPLLARCYVSAFSAAIVISGEKGVQASVASQTSTTLEARLSWS